VERPNTLMPRGAKLSAYMTEKAICQRLVLVPTPRRFALIIELQGCNTFPLTSSPLTLQLFPDFSVFSFTLFPGVPPQFFNISK